jgi:hypothetical protein
MGLSRQKEQEMTTTIYLGSQKIPVPGWPGTQRRGSYWMRKQRTAGLYSIGYGRASYNPKAAHGIQDSADEQAALYLKWVEDFETIDIADGALLDPSASAGISARQEREYFAKALEIIRSNPRVQIFWVLTSSRIDRGSGGFYKLAAASAEHGVLWAVGDSIYNPANRQDYYELFGKHAADVMAPAAAVEAAAEGRARALRDGRAHGRPPYGLRRRRTGDSLRNRAPGVDVPDDRQPPGQPAPDTPEQVVKEIFARAEAGETMMAIATGLERRRVYVPVAAGKAFAGTLPEQASDAWLFGWRHSTLHYITENPAYAGLRRSNGKIHDDVQANIEPLISPAQFEAARRSIDSRRTGKGRAPRRSEATMLARVALCGVCGTPLSPSSRGLHKDGSRARTYACHHHAHVTIIQDRLDEYVARKVIAWLTIWPEARESLADHSDDLRAEKELAESEVARLQGKINRLWESFDTDGSDLDEVDVLRRIKKLKGDMEIARERAERATGVSQEITEASGPDAGVRWHGCGPLKQRLLISQIVQVTVHRSPRAGSPTLAGRVSLAWKLAPLASEPGWMPGDAEDPWVPSRRRRARRVAAWLADQDGPRSALRIAAGLGEDVRIIRETATAMAEAGQLAREKGPSERGGPHTWHYEPANSGQDSRQGEGS